jgi:hypothetical protein
VLEVRGRLKDCEAVTQFNKVATESVGHVRMWQVTAEQGRHHLQAGLALRLLRTGQTGVASATFESPLPDLRQLGMPSGQGGFDRAVSFHLRLDRCDGERNGMSIR